MNLEQLREIDRTNIHLVGRQVDISGNEVVRRQREADLRRREAQREEIIGMLGYLNPIKHEEITLSFSSPEKNIAPITAVVKFKGLNEQNRVVVIEDGEEIPYNPEAFFQALPTDIANELIQQWNCW